MFGVSFFFSQPASQPMNKSAKVDSVSTLWLKGKFIKYANLLNRQNNKIPCTHIHTCDRRPYTLEQNESTLASITHEKRTIDFIYTNLFMDCVCVLVLLRCNHIFCVCGVSLTHRESLFELAATTASAAIRE